jgi:tetratricopeptide (TPR) repeat protein
MRSALLVALAACGGSQHVSEHRALDLTKYLPATFEADKPKQGEPRSVHVRVWADATVRAQPHWKDDITEQLDYASQLWTPMFGVKLVADEFKDWAREGDPHTALEALAKLDDGKDVTWVVGYIAAGDAASTAMSELGDAHVLGHHVIVRGWADKAETAQVEVRTASLEAKERAEVISAHKRHKQSVVLLHFLGQTLGAIAEADPAWVQHPSYSEKQGTLSDRNRELVQLAIDERLDGGTDPTIAHDVLEAIEKQEWGGWIPLDHDQVVATLRSVVERAKVDQTAADVPPAALEEFERVRGLGKSGQTEAALRELDNLLIAYPANATLHELKCELMIAKPGVADPKTRAACTRTAELAPGDPTVHFAVGEALAKTGDLGGARTELEQAQMKIANLMTGRDDAWRRLVGVYVGLGALTWAEDAIAAGKLDKDPAAAGIAQTRARYGVPRGSKHVRPEAEAALVTAVRNALDLVYANKIGEAERALAMAERKWPGAAGLSAARCDLYLRTGHVDSARAACARSLATDPDDSWALYLSGVLALKDTGESGTKTGVAQLKRAIEVDPALGQAWRALGKAYQRAKDQVAFAQLAQDYQARFGQPLEQ